MRWTLRKAKWWSAWSSIMLDHLLSFRYCPSSIAFGIDACAKPIFELNCFMIISAFLPFGFDFTPLPLSLPLVEPTGEAIEADGDCGSGGCHYRSWHRHHRVLLHRQACSIEQALTGSATHFVLFLCLFVLGSSVIGTLPITSMLDYIHNNNIVNIKTLTTTTTIFS